MSSLKPLFILIYLLASPLLAYAQEAVDHKAYFVQIESIVRANSSRSLGEHLFDKCEIKIDANRKEYSRSQAEAVLKTFFQENSANEFDFVHNGKNGTRDLIYAIGNYSTNTANYRLVIRAKKFEDTYKIFRIEFTKER